MLDLTEEISSMITERHMDEEKVLSLVRDMLVSAYKRKFGTDENAVVRFFPNQRGEENRMVEIYSVKEVVEEENWYDRVRQIPLDEAETLADGVEVGDSLEIPLDPKSFEYSAVQSAKQRSQQVVKEYNTDRVYVDAKAMEGKLVIGEIKKSLRNGDFLVNLNLEETDAIFPVRGQSPRESYEIQEKLKFFVEKVDRGEENRGRDAMRGKQQKKGGVRILLSRASKEFVKALIENEVPEISSGDVEIKAIARHAGIRTKVAVDTRKTDIDPVGSTVGKAGTRIQTVMTECEGEKIDIVRYSDDPLVYIANALIVIGIPQNVAHQHLQALLARLFLYGKAFGYIRADGLFQKQVIPQVQRLHRVAVMVPVLRGYDHQIRHLTLREKVFFICKACVFGHAPCGFDFVYLRLIFVAYGNYLHPVCFGKVRTVIFAAGSKSQHRYFKHNSPPVLFICQTPE